MINARLITLAREAAGLTQAALAHAAGVSQAHLSKIEHGLEEPNNHLLSVLAEQCDVPVEFFSQPDQPIGEGLVDLFHRKRATLPAKPLKRAHAKVNVARLEVLRLLRTVELTEVSPFPLFAIDEFDPPEDIAQKVRAMWRVPPGPLPDLIALIEATGTPVLKMSFDHEKLSAITLPGESGRYVIGLNGRLPASHQRFTLAHELGHLVMHQHAVDEDIERQADAFASALLMPAADIRPQLRGVRFRDLGRLKHVWRVSLAALIRRARELGEITDRQYRTFNMQLNQLPGGRRNEPGEFEPEYPRLILSLMEHYQRSLGYTPEEVARLIVAREPVMRERYFGEPKRILRPVGRLAAELHSFPVPRG
jgi:Zn-dependent peptidase ImmA (M78 family)/DNA-binding XRE family transcriptional regulator